MVRFDLEAQDITQSGVALVSAVVLHGDPVF
jgi:hypothetical protein